MKNSSYYIAPVGDRTHDLPHTVASNMVKVPLTTRPHANTHGCIISSALPGRRVARWVSGVGCRLSSCWRGRWLRTSVGPSVDTAGSRVGAPVACPSVDQKTSWCCEPAWSIHPGKTPNVTYVFSLVSFTQYIATSREHAINALW